MQKKYNSVTNERTDLGVGYVYHFTQKTVHRDQLFLQQQEQGWNNAFIVTFRLIEKMRDK